jgi:hypothetical protein
MNFVGQTNYLKIVKFYVLAVYAKIDLHKKFDLILIVINCLFTSYAFYGVIKPLKRVYKSF